jgi:hypothetical protein
VRYLCLGLVGLLVCWDGGGGGGEGGGEEACG